MARSAQQLYTNARFFTAHRRPWADALLVTDGLITYVGAAETAARLASADCSRIDLEGALVLPGFVDGHAHVLGTGNVQTQADLWGAYDLAEIQRRIGDWARRNPDAPRVLAHGWQHAAIPGARPDRGMLDDVVPDRPAYAYAFDFHSVWLNSAALSEVGIDAGTPDPIGGRIERDPVSGEATGYIDETAMEAYVDPHVRDGGTDDDADVELAAALGGYAKAGVTAAIDMGLDRRSLDAMLRAEANGDLTTRVVGHWFVNRCADPADNVAQVERAAELAAEVRSARLRVVGVKVIVDGTVDGCTAALKLPYAGGATAEPIWDLDALEPVVAAADAAGLQVAMHAIGDEAVSIAISAVEHAVAVNGPKRRRHRIEHLEVTDPADIQRLAALGITASMQPVHADPAIAENWRKQLGDDRVDRGFAWPQMTDAGAVLALGTDSPTSPFAPLPNMYVAATRRSALRDGLEPNLEHFKLPLADAIVHATRDAAWSCAAEDEFGALAAGLAADFICIDRDVLAAEPEELLRAKVTRTVVDGVTVWEA